MAITVTNKLNTITSIGSGSSSHTTGSITITSGKSYLISVVYYDQIGNSVTSNSINSVAGISWQKQTPTANGGNGYYCAFVGTAASSTTSGITINVSTATTALCFIMVNIDEISGASSTPIVQQAVSGGAPPSLSAFASSNNGTYAYCVDIGWASLSPKSGWSQGGYYAGGSTYYNPSFLTEWIASNDTSPTCTGFNGWTTGWACEIQAASAGATSNNVCIINLGC